VNNHDNEFQILDLGSWFLIPGSSPFHLITLSPYHFSWFLVLGSWFFTFPPYHFSWFLAPGSWFFAPGSINTNIRKTNSQLATRNS
jgi:hypothetical protein